MSNGNQRPRQRSKTNKTTSNYLSRSIEVKFIPVLVLNEAMSRARMLRPQGSMTEASLPAREIAMRARRAQSRMLSS
jgi:hypothetical protein